MLFLFYLAARAESLFFDSVPVDKIGKKKSFVINLAPTYFFSNLGIKNERMSNLEYLGNDMIEAGNEFGTTTPYGAALIRVGHTEKKYNKFSKKNIRFKFSFYSKFLKSGWVY